METTRSVDYGVLDRPEVLTLLFHPRREHTGAPERRSGMELLIPVEDDIAVGARLHLAGPDNANILFFHGNGEIVGDYDELGPQYNRMGINFLPVDYRGYGRSGGKPTVSSMMRDCHAIFEYVRQWLAENSCTGPLVVMGRSLGSASALDLAFQHAEFIDALIIESGFAMAGPLLRLLGIDARRLGFEEGKGFRNIDKIGAFKNPTLVIHAEYDHIIPFSEGRMLFKASGADDKHLLMIPEANHNDIFMRGPSEYLGAIGDLVRKLS